MSTQPLFWVFDAKDKVNVSAANIRLGGDSRIKCVKHTFQNAKDKVNVSAANIRLGGDSKIKCVKHTIYDFNPIEIFGEATL